LLVSAAVVCLWGLWQYQAGIDVTAEHWVDGEQFPGLKTRVFSTLGNPNVLAAFLIMIVGLTAGWILDVRGRWPRFALLGLLGVSVLCVLLTYSRGAWLTLGVMALVTAAAWKHWTWRMVALAAVAVAVVGVAAQDAFMARLLSIRGMFNPADSSVALRWALWESTLAMIEEHPWLGLGWGSYRFVYPEYDFFVQNPDVIIYHGHNTLLSLAAEIGIPGMICFAMAWATAACRTLLAMHRTDRPKKGPYLGLALALLGMAAFSLTDHVLFNIQVTAVFWVLLALASVAPVERTASERQLAYFHKKFTGVAGVFRSRENIIHVK
jgi:putative inorganic carbon (HCO3(-)) transporter